MLRVDPGHLPLLATLLRAEGFRTTPWQWHKLGQVFGLVRNVEERLRLHMRGFASGWVESEIEPAPRYVEHHTRRPGNADGFTAGLLKRAGIPYSPITAIRRTIRYRAPSRLIDWRPIAATAVAAALLLLVSRRLSPQD